MSYEPYTWQSGDVVTSARLNHMEQGIAGGGGALKITPTITEVDNQVTETWNKTAGEIMDAMPLVYFDFGSDGYHEFQFLTSYGWSEDDGFSSEATTSANEVTAATRNDYPSATWNDK